MEVAGGRASQEGRFPRRKNNNNDNNNENKNSEAILIMAGKRDRDRRKLLLADLSPRSLSYDER